MIKHNGEKASRIKTFVSLILLLISSQYSCQNKDTFHEYIILEVDDKTIDINTFREIYESDPTFPGHKTGAVELMEYAEKLCDQILAGKLGKKENIFRKKRLKYKVDYKFKKVTIRQFYKQEIADKIKISEEELQSVYKKMSVRFKVKHLFAYTKEEADELFQSLQSGVLFDTLAREVFENVDPAFGGSELGEISWGDLDSNIEEELFRLPPNKFSKPIQSRWGYHILLVTGRSENLLLTEDEYQRKRHLIYAKVKKKKEEKAAGKYLKDFLDPFTIKIKAKSYYKIITTLKMNSDAAGGGILQSFLPLDNDDIELLRSKLAVSLKEAFMTSSTGIWTIEDFLDKMDQLPVEHRPNLSSSEQFKKDIGIFIRNEFLFERATKLGLDHYSSVDSIVSDYAQKIAYEYYLKKNYSAYEAPEEVIKYYATNFKERKKTDSTILRGMSNLEIYKYYYASRELHQYLRNELPDIRVRINKDLIQKESERINWNRPLRIYIPEY